MNTPARCSPELAAWLDRSGVLRAAGLLEVVDDQPAVDPRPGAYYVSVVREHDGAWRPLAGPYDSHAEALGKVDQARARAMDMDPRAPWYSYGTCRMEPDATCPRSILGVI